jgi:AraC family transcriptional regulator
VFRSLDARAKPVATLRAFRAVDYSALLQVGGAMCLPRLYNAFHVIGVPLSAGYPIARSGDGHQWTGRLALGDVSLYPAGPGERIVWPEGAVCLYIHLTPAFVARHAGIAAKPDAVTIARHHRVHDPVVYDIGHALIALLTARGDRPVRRADALMSALAAHLARYYLLPSSPAVMLGCRPLADVLAEVRVGDTGAGMVPDLARSCGLTRAHFTRRFRLLTGASPHALSLGSRVERAKDLLAVRRRAIAEVAHDTGFSDQSHLSHVFRRLVGMTPAGFRAFHAQTLEALATRGSTNLQDRS